MQLTQSNIIKLSLASLCIILIITLTNCCSSDYIYVKVKKSELIPDSYELNRDSLLVGGIRICKMAQRFYNKPISLGGGGRSFTGFFLYLRFVKTEYGEYALSSVRPNKIHVTCKGKLTGFDEMNPMKMEFVVTSTSIMSMIHN